jgi:hypothetical protein
MANFAIIKYAAAWSHYGYNEDPRVAGVEVGCSGNAGYSRKYNVDCEYDSREKAEIACESVKEYNPGGFFDVCPIIEDAASCN